MLFQTAKTATTDRIERERHLANDLARITEARRKNREDTVELELHAQLFAGQNPARTLPDFKALLQECQNSLKKITASKNQLEKLKTIMAPCSLANGELPDPDHMTESELQREHTFNTIYKAISSNRLSISDIDPEKCLNAYHLKLELHAAIFKAQLFNVSLTRLAFDTMIEAALDETAIFRLFEKLYDDATKEQALKEQAIEFYQGKMQEPSLIPEPIQIGPRI